jgi:hypothetical protein
LYIQKETIMKTSKFLAVAAIAAASAAASVAYADDADASQHVHQFNGSRTRAEVQAEAAQVSRNRSTEPAGSRVASPIKSTIDVQTLRAETAQAVRLGQIPQGEASRI